MRGGGAVAAGTLLLAATGCSGPLQVDAATPAAADRDACRAFIDGLPPTVADQPEREVEPADGWAAAFGDPPIVVRCGVPTPTTYDDETAVCTNVNGVDWFIPLEQLEDGEAASYTMTTVNRTPRVEAVLPSEHFPPATAMADLAAAADAHLSPSDEGCD